MVEEIWSGEGDKSTAAGGRTSEGDGRRDATEMEDAISTHEAVNLRFVDVIIVNLKAHPRLAPSPDHFVSRGDN